MVANRLDVWSLLGDQSRRAIVEQLSVQPLSVVELAGEMPISRPAVSQHLKVLKDAGVVTDAVMGRTRVYRLDEQRLARYRRQLDQFWSDTLRNFSSSVGEHTDGAEVVDEGRGAV